MNDAISEKDGSVNTVIVRRASHHGTRVALTARIFARSGLFCLALLLPLLSACGGGGGGGGSGSDATPPVGATGGDYRYAQPVARDDGWTTASLVDSAADIAPIEALVNGIYDGEHRGIDAIAIAVAGNLVLDLRFRSSLDEFDGWIDNRDLNRHGLHSVSKSVASTLVGLAIEQGYLPGTDLALLDFFPHGPYDNWDDRKRDISLEHALTMRLGLDWDETSQPYGTPGNSLWQLFNDPRNLTRSLFNLPLVRDPGTHFVYNTGASIALGELVELAVGMPMEDYAQRELFAPLQISEAAWSIEANGIPNTGSGLFLNTRSMLKLGELYLRGGQWQGRQLLSADWVQRSTERSVSLNWEYTTGYGYQWWLGEFNANGRRYGFYSARGYGGQFIFVLPDLELVVAFHGRNYENGLYALPFRLTERYIIPSLQ